MTYHGRIKNGVVALEPPVTLPDGTYVRVEIDPVDSEFWNAKTIVELAREQGTQSVVNPAVLAIDWPKDESVDDLLALVREVRH